MIATTYSGTPVFLINDLANWARPVEVSFEVQAKRLAGKTNREEREAMAAELITTMEFSSLLTSAEHAALRSAEDSWDNRPVLCPFWPAMKKLDGTASVVGSLKVWFEPGFTTWELGTGNGPSGFTPSANCFVAPVMWGRFVRFPTTVTINGKGDAAVTFEVVENGPASLALTPNATTLSTSVVNTLTVPTFTVPFAWGDNEAEIEVRIRRGKIGFGRADADDFWPQIPRRKQKMRFAALDTADLRYLLTLFKDRYGSVKPWRCATNHNAATFKLGRFYSDVLRITWEKPALGGELANASVEFIALPTEEIALAGETPGSTIGGVPSRWFGYVVTDGTTTWRFTSYESSISGPGGTFEPRSINHGTIREEINLQIEDTTLEVQNWPGSPFTRLRNQHASAPLTVSIYEGLVSNPGAAQRIFTGTAQAPETEGSRWRIKLTGLGALLSLKGPRSCLQETCMAVFGDSRCKMNVASVSVTKTFVGSSDGVAEFSSAAGIAAHRFAAGTAKRTLSDGTVQRYLIVDSYTLGNGNLACVLAGSISPPPTGEESGWVLEPGCPGTVAACKGFGNYVNFRGAPYLPKANPAMVVVKSSTGGKK